MFHDHRQLRSDDPEAFQHGGIAALLFVERSNYRTFLVAEERERMGSRNVPVRELTG